MNYRGTVGGYLNCEKRIFDSTNYYDFPDVAPVKSFNVEDAKLIGFNYALTEKNPEDKIVHFFLDDYQFERVWNSPERYVPVLKRFKAVLAPDFSMYSDFPLAVQMFNHYRKQWCSAYWQEDGITVIPTLAWSTEDSFKFCFDGIPKHSIVATSSVGSIKNVEARKAWLNGFHKALDIVQPSEVLLVGKLLPEVKWDGKITVISSPNMNDIDAKCTRHNVVSPSGKA